jgi:hypothetical protein
VATRPASASGTPSGRVQDARALSTKDAHCGQRLAQRVRKTRRPSVALWRLPAEVAEAADDTTISGTLAGPTPWHGGSHTSVADFFGAGDGESAGDRMPTLQAGMPPRANRRTVQSTGLSRGRDGPSQSESPRG